VLTPYAEPSIFRLAASIRGLGGVQVLSDDLPGSPSPSAGGIDDIRASGSLCTGGGIYDGINTNANKKTLKNIMIGT
jgi:hypothetical protein